MFPKSCRFIFGKMHFHRFFEAGDYTRQLFLFRTITRTTTSITNDDDDNK